MQKRTNEKRDALMSATIAVISRDGLERLTTKSVEAESGVSERYIFLYYGSKDGLLRQTFDTVERSFAAILCGELRRALESERGTEAGLRKAWTAVWKYLTGHADQTRFYIRYFYSEQFERFSRQDHERNLAPAAGLLRPLFTDDAAADGTLGYMFTTMLSSTLAGITGTQQSDPVLCERIFRMLYQSVRDRLAPPERTA